MTQFVDRRRELQKLNELLENRNGQFVVVYGQRRVGKTTLLLHWIQQADRPYIYWVARRGTANDALQSFAEILWSCAYPDADDPEPPRFSSWSQLFKQMARMIGEHPPIIVCDEFPYAVEADPSLPHHLQVAWDHYLKDKPLTLVLAGSHVGTMVDLFDYEAPLFGRATARLLINPLPYAALTAFFPRYPATERVATYAVLGGVPAYLEQFNNRQGLSLNIRQYLFQNTGMFRHEPGFLISDLVRETRNYEAAMRAIANGHHTLSAMAKIIGVASPNLAPYVKRLCALGLIERRIPSTIPPYQRQKTTRSRYYLRDHYLRFYFRFIEPNLEMIELGLADMLWKRISKRFRVFVGQTAFGELCREWVQIKARAGELPFVPEVVGSHWTPHSQVDVVAVNWEERAILLGDYKWGADAVAPSVIRELVNKTPSVVPAGDWQVHYVFFSHDSFTGAARTEAEAVGAQLVDLETLDADLRSALQ